MTSYSDRVDDLIDRIDDRNPLWIVEEAVEKFDLTQDQVAWMRATLDEEAARESKAGNVKNATVLYGYVNFLGGLTARARRPLRGDHFDYQEVDYRFRKLVSRMRSGSLKAAQLRRDIKQKIAKRRAVA